MGSWLIDRIAYQYTLIKPP